MGITPKDPADFDPIMGNYTDLRPFRFWCQKVLPLVYDDSLSYYEVLCKLVDYLNKTMEDVGVLHEDVDALNTAYHQLQSYVNDYFSTLNVQQEINNKLDIMAADGTLDALLLPYFNTYKQEINAIVADQTANLNNAISRQDIYIDNQLSAQSTKINTLEGRMDTFTNLPDGSTSGDAELADIRVGGNGVTYATAGDAVRAQFNSVRNDLDLFQNGKYSYFKGAYQNGSISYGIFLPQYNYRVSETDIISYDHDIKMHVKNGYRVVLSIFVNNAFDHDSAWITNDYIIAANTQFKIMIAKVTEDTSVVANVNEFKAAVYYDSVIKTNYDDLKYKQDQLIKSIINQKPAINFEIGGLLTDGTDYNNETWRIRSKLTILNYDLIVTANKGFRFTYYYFSDAQMHNPVRADWCVGDKYLIIPKNTYFRLLYTWIDHDSSSYAITDLLNSVIYSNIYVYDQSNPYWILLNNKQKEIISSLTNLKPTIDFEVGGLLSDGTDYNNEPWRVRSKLTYLEDDIVVSTNIGFRFIYYTFDDAQMQNPVRHGWLTGEAVIPKHTYFRLLFSWIDHDSSSYAITDLYTSVQYNNIFIYSQYNQTYKAMQQIDSIKGYNPICLSIAHQGYSNTETYGRSKQESYVNAAYHGFDVGECDIQWSSDSVPVCCHDLSFVDSNDGTTTIVIADHTLTELKTYGYYGGTIATLDEVVNTCKSVGLKVEIDQIADGLTNDQWATLFNIIKKYRMQDNTLWSISILSADDSRILNFYDKSVIVYNVNNTTDLQSIIDTKLPYIDPDANYVLSLNYANIATSDISDFNEDLSNFNVKTFAWTIDNTEVYKSYIPYVDGIISNKLTAKVGIFN